MRHGTVNYHVTPQAIRQRLAALDEQIADAKREGRARDVDNLQRQRDTLTSKAPRSSTGAPATQAAAGERTRLQRIDTIAQGRPDLHDLAHRAKYEEPMTPAAFAAAVAQRDHAAAIAARAQRITRQMHPALQSEPG